jgi:hypothetical protein
MPLQAFLYNDSGPNEGQKAAVGKSLRLDCVFYNAGRIETIPIFCKFDLKLLEWKPYWLT